MARSTSTLAYFFFVASTTAFALAQNPPPNAPSNAVPPSGSPPKGVAAPQASAPAGVSPGAGGASPAPGGAHGAAKAGPPSLFVYEPSFSMAIAGSVLFIICSTISLIQFFKYKSWTFMIFVQAVVAAAVGAIARTHAVLHPGAMLPFMVQTIAFSLVPAVLALSIMFTVTRVIWWVTPNDKRNKQVLGLPQHHLTFFWGLGFVVPDLIKGVISQVGKPPKGQHPNPKSLAHRIEEICLVIQFFVLMLYTLWAARFMRMSSRWLISGEAEARDWRTLGWVNVIASALLTWRTLWGVVEFDARYNPQAFISQHEWPYWFADILPILIIFILYQVYYPGKYLPREYTRFKFNTKALEKQKLDNPWPLAISNPISTPNDKDIEIITREVVPSSTPPGHRV